MLLPRPAYNCASTFGVRPSKQQQSEHSTMSTVALVVGTYDVRLWNLTSRERIARQLHQAGGLRMCDDVREAQSHDQVLVLNGKFLFEVRTLAVLLERVDRVLRHGDEVAGAYVASEDVGVVVAHLHEASALPARLVPLNLAGEGQFDHQLRKAKPPLLEPVSAERQSELEALLYGSAYKGITDIVTKYLWPRPARTGVRWCAQLGISPNAVTTFGFLLMVAACYAFAQGMYISGLLAGWLMTYLDTVDGKLARVTVTSSRFGHLFDHGMDIIHPPFWYVYWGISLVAMAPWMEIDRHVLYWLVIWGYVGGRLIEVLFHLLGSASIFSWRPFDAYFRLVTARRNPCLILLTVCTLLGRPDWGFLLVVFWTVASTAIMLVRLVQGVAARVQHGPLVSWLSDSGHAAATHPRAYRAFSGTRSAYATD